MALSPDWVYAPVTTAIQDLGSTEYKEADGSDTFETGEADGEITRIFYTSWDVRSSFMDAVLGYSVNNGNGTLSRPSLPDQHPAFKNYYATKVKLEKVGMPDRYETSSKLPRYLAAKFTVTYTPVTYHVTDDEHTDNELQRFVTREYVPGADYFTVNGGMKFTTSGVVLSQQPAKITTFLELNYTWHKVPAKPGNPFVPPNVQKISDCVGRINSEVFDLEGMNLAPGTVLCLPPETRLVPPRVTSGNPDNNYQWEIMFKFLYRENGYGLDGNLAGHQYLYDQANAGWDKVVSTLSGQPLYEEEDLNILFTLDT